MIIIDDALTNIFFNIISIPLYNIVISYYKYHFLYLHVPHFQGLFTIYLYAVNIFKCNVS
jgi:hypothetical protein